MKAAIRFLVWAAVPLTVAVMGAASLLGEPVTEPPEKGFRILFPKDGATITRVKAELIAVAAQGEKRPQLTVDGKLHEWAEFGDPVWVARLELKPGEHRLRLGEKELRVTVAPIPGENTKSLLRNHPVEDDEWRECSMCHPVQMENETVFLERPALPYACDDCHSPDDFDAIHFHPKEPLDSCDICHDLHAAPYDKLLRAPVKKLCAQCHD